MVCRVAGLLKHERGDMFLRDKQDLNTVLAALRFYQQQGMGDPSNRSDEIHAIATDGDTDISMDGGGIDALCEHLNTAQSVDIDELTSFIDDLAQCYSENGEYNFHSAPFGTSEIAEKARSFSDALSGCDLDDDRVVPRP